MSTCTPYIKGLSEAAMKELALHAFIPLDVIGRHQYIVSVRHGVLVDRGAFIAVLSGKPPLDHSK